MYLATLRKTSRPFRIDDAVGMHDGRIDVRFDLQRRSAFGAQRIGQLLHRGHFDHPLARSAAHGLDDQRQATFARQRSGRIAGACVFPWRHAQALCRHQRFHQRLVAAARHLVGPRPWYAEGRANRGGTFEQVFRERDHRIEVAMLRHRGACFGEQGRLIVEFLEDAQILWRPPADQQSLGASVVAQVDNVVFAMVDERAVVGQFVVPPPGSRIARPPVENEDSSFHVRYPWRPRRVERVRAVNASCRTRPWHNRLPARANHRDSHAPLAESRTGS